MKWASQAGKYLKKTVLELGGSDPFIVLADADFNTACKTGVSSRMLNSGQVCISAKRFIVEETIFDQFVNEQKVLLESLRLGDPMNEQTDVGPMARTDLLEHLEKQVDTSIKMGAHLVTGGHRIKEYFYAPTLLTNIEKGMPAYDDETFGPVSVVIPAKDAEDAIRIANDTTFGLGASIWTKNLFFTAIHVRGCAIRLRTLGTMLTAFGRTQDNRDDCCPNRAGGLFVCRYATCQNARTTS